MCVLPSILRQLILGDMPQPNSARPARHPAKRPRSVGGRPGARSDVYRPLRYVDPAAQTVASAFCERAVVVILEKAGLLLGREGVVDAYDRAANTEIANASLKDVRPDIVHQCLLALFDSELGSQRRLRVYISLFARSGRTIEVSPALRPPRTFRRFKGLVAALLRDGEVRSVDGTVLMKILPGSVAPVVPYGAPVIGLTNSVAAPVRTATQLAREALAAPVDDKLQGGVKSVAGFFCISCTDEVDLDGVDYVTQQVCLSAYPTTAHVMCARICEGFTRVANSSAATGMDSGE
ncbi:rRNA small subunit pseudouridine methyltransferase Nep1 [Trypanosoma rangeli]|uniref:rRNA small subunit pseudouridine methyltransferase Nep1 n=1 Tax=Trypanosoma rangeli TaxID=5698 RepID=A0A422NAI1_TRYRA|nr:rRNA small subunit pseudouridine methyltransferase Nep1 [Trypanosoma rangeli]RNF02484.1 rRNA small subunit pseudouridine methyltransferase Nep1 [Trypanosoma rangeli]|eukprot:RNF02484.1 rRNA small subunit pseudouridine methyltransferase Nep1 [Trypanosoma rangeli]